MKGQFIDVIKDIFTSLLIISCIILVLAVIFYDNMPFIKQIPESEEYTLTAQMKKELEDEELEDTKEVIVNYYIDGSDLKKYEKNNEYDKGKSDPFDIYFIEENNNNSNNNSSSDNSGNFYEDDGTK